MKSNFLPSRAPRLVVFAAFVSSCGGQTGDSPGAPVTFGGAQNTGGKSVLPGGASSVADGTGGVPWIGGNGQGGSVGGKSPIQLTAGMLSSGGNSTIASTTSTGGSAAVTGGQTSTAGSSNIGSGGTSGQDCASRAEVTCGQDCYAVYGSPTGDFLHNSVYAGCLSHGACTDFSTCAYPPDHPESCLIFATGCFPDGWLEDYSCSKFSCPTRLSRPDGGS
jgi:hypothetical protein